MEYDVIVVGAGHAGIEAALAAARIGVSTCLVTMNPDSVGRMACNPAIGGIAKGTVVREVDALGGEMGRVADRTGIQFRMLNTGRGPSVRAPRAQSDREGYSRAMGAAVKRQENLSLVGGEVTGLLVENGAVSGIRVKDRGSIPARSVVLTTGTFLRGVIHLGERRMDGGRMDEPPAANLSDSLREWGIHLSRLKTGTPPRIDGNSVDFHRLAIQHGDADPQPFSFQTPHLRDVEQMPCYATWTNEAVHELVRTNLHRAPLYTGQIRAVGPRYCMSLETKITRFPDRERHQVFLEPEGRDTEEMYLNGISTSLPEDLQEKVVHAIPGLSGARITRYGYAIEYDFVPPRGQIDVHLESRAVRGLFLAGQINGTSGYEEAAGQGIIAGVNAARRVLALAPVKLGRDEAFIGVMIDDLVTRGTTEPYRLFTSRAEHRLLLRQDNADRRLTRLGVDWGCAEGMRLEALRAHEDRISRAKRFLAETRRGEKTLEEILRRPEVRYGELEVEEAGLGALGLDRRAAEQVEIEVKYKGYIGRQRMNIERVRAMEVREIPAEFDYLHVEGLSNEAREKLHEARPSTLGQAGRVEGVTHADVSVLAVGLKRWVSRAGRAD